MCVICSFQNDHMSFFSFNKRLWIKECLLPILVDDIKFNRMKGKIAKKCHLAAIHSPFIHIRKNKCTQTQTYWNFTPAIWIWIAISIFRHLHKIYWCCWAEDSLKCTRSLCHYGIYTLEFIYEHCSLSSRDYFF